MIEPLDPADRVILESPWLDGPLPFTLNAWTLVNSVYGRWPELRQRLQSWFDRDLRPREIANRPEVVGPFTLSKIFPEDFDGGVVVSPLWEEATWDELGDQMPDGVAPSDYPQYERNVVDRIIRRHRPPAGSLRGRNGREDPEPRLDMSTARAEVLDAAGRLEPTLGRVRPDGSAIETPAGPISLYLRPVDGTVISGRIHAHRNELVELVDLLLAELDQRLLPRPEGGHNGPSERITPETALRDQELRALLQRFRDTLTAISTTRPDPEPVVEAGAGVWRCFLEAFVPAAGGSLGQQVGPAVSAAGICGLLILAGLPIATAAIAGVAAAYGTLGVRSSGAD